MTQTGPDTTHSTQGALPFYHFGGYHYDDDEILGFSHEHANGMGVNDFGTMLVLPRAGWDDSFVDSDERAAPFEHAQEHASPGSYQVRLADDGTEVEIAATRHGAIHRYEFPDGGRPVVLLDLGHRLGTVEIGESSVAFDAQTGRVDAFQVLEGAYSGRFGGLKTWAHLGLDPAPTQVGVWSDAHSPMEGTPELSGRRVGMWLQFPPGTTSGELRVALSHVDAEGARSNYSEELDGLDFEEIRQRAQAAWAEQLGRVRVRGGTHEERVVFHTALYHAALWPNVFSDVDGRYRGLDDGVRHAEFLYHSNFSMWDTFRTTHPWFTLVQPEKSLEFAQSLTQMAKDGGDMPRWPLGHGYTGGMVGSPASQILAGTWLKGVRGWDSEAAFASCFLQATEVTAHVSRTAIELYRELGYVPMEASSGSTSLGLEYAWNDAALALWGTSLGYDEEAETLGDSATWWRNNWDPAQGFMLGRRADGSFRDMTDPDTWASEFVEGNAWHYRWPAPFDVAGMIDLQYGGDLADFRADYELYWSRVAEEEDDVFPDTYYWHGNEPDLHHAWLGSLAGIPEATLQAVRLLMSTRYDTSPAGLDGNDDAGTLSAWYLFAASGLYPVAGTTQYAVTIPLFDRVELDRPDGMLVVEREGEASAQALPTSPLLGEEELGSWVVEHDQLIEGGRLRFVAPH